MSTLAKLFILSFYLFMSWSFGVLCGQSTPVIKPVYYQTTKQVPVYLPVHKGKHFQQQVDLLSASIPANLLHKKGH